MLLNLFLNVFIKVQKNMFYVFLFQNLCFTYVFILSILVLFAYRYSFRL